MVFHLLLIIYGFSFTMNDIFTQCKEHINTKYNPTNLPADSKIGLMLFYFLS